MNSPRPIAIELAVQLTLALAIGLGVSLALAGATLLIAGHDVGEPRAAQTDAQAGAKP